MPRKWDAEKEKFYRILKMIHSDDETLPLYVGLISWHESRGTTYVCLP